MVIGTRPTLVLCAEADTAIRRHGREAYPHECCGALIGREQLVVEALALPNATGEGSRRRFLVRPADYWVAERRAAELGAALLGFYHSHPDHPARQRGNASLSGVLFLKSLGYRNVRSISGGTLAWREKGFATDAD